MNKLVSGAYGIEIPVGTQTKILLPEILDLKGKRIKHIDVCDQMLYAPSGLEIAKPVAYLTIIEQNSKEEKVQSLSFKQLTTSTANGNRHFINKIVDFTQSYIEVVSPSTYTGKSLFLVFWYDEPRVWNNIPEKTNRTTISSFEVPITATNLSKYMFPDNRTLFGKKFQNLLLFANSTGKTPEGKTPITVTLSNKAYVTLKKDNYEFFKQVPLSLFNQSSVLFPLRLQNIQFDFTNSFIEFGEKTGLTTAMSVMFNTVNDDN